MDKIIFIFLISLNLFAAQWNPAYLGEKTFTDYIGPLGGDAKSNEIQGEYVSLGGGLLVEEEDFYGKTYLRGDLLRENQIGATVEDSFFELFNQIDNIKSSLVCPQFEMTENYNYYRYLYRLLAISYLFENIKFHNYTARKLDLNNACKLNYKKIFNNCQPKSRDMQFFIKNVEIVLDNIKPELVPFDHNVKKFKKNWITDFKKSKLTDMTQVRLYDYCTKNKCKGLDKKKKLKSYLDKICDEDSSTIIQVCSENDRLFGMSNNIYAFKIIKDSDALLAVNKNGFAKGCLRRFAIQNKDLEKSNSVLKSIFPLTYDYLSKNFDDRFKQGQLYPLGSLKLFLDQGLSSFLEEDKQEVVLVSKEKKVVEKKLPPLAPEPLKPFFKQKKVTKKKIQKKKVVQKKEVVKSHFLKADEIRREYNLYNIEVEMDKFKFDYVFTPKMKNILESKLKKFTTLTGLKEMKEYDYLGSPKGPVPLRFIKYLIDTDNHKGLYNMLQVLGDNFYVMNDIDEKKLVKSSNLVELKNDLSTNYQWQIFILSI
jgi:hypothetical protein